MTPTQVDIGRIQSGNGQPAWLSPSAAASLRRVDAQRGKTTPVNWAGRSEAEQFDLVKKYYVRASSGEFKYDGSWWRKKPGSRVVVARPTTSPHEPGNAVDTDEYTVPGFVALMAEHGWIRTLKSEPWHFVYFASRDKHRNDPVPPAEGGASTGGSAATSKETDMDCMILINGKIYALAPGFIKHCDSTAQVTEAKARGVKQYDYTGTDRLNQWVRALDFYGVPRDVLDKNGYVINPENKQAKPGGLWTWSRAVLAAVKR